jgi:hypothetical protein
MDVQVFRVSGPHIAAKLMDGELVVINLRNGLYYSSTGVGVRIWEGVEKGASVNDISDDIVRHFDVDAARAAADTAAFIEKLQAEALIEAASDAALREIATTAPVERLAYESPTLTTFDDMAETFALDPPLKV